MHRFMLMAREARLFAVVVLALVVTSCSPAIGGNDSTTITAYFPDSAGLFEGNDVGILGVPVGKVTELEPEGTKVKATLEVDGGYDIPANARAVVVARSIATDRYVELTPVYRSGPKLEDDAKIGLERTQTPVDFDEVLQSLNTFATQISGSKASRDAVKNIINDGARVLKGKGQLFNDTVGRLAAATNGLSGQRTAISESLISLDALISEIAANEGTAREFIQQVSKASRMLAEERNNFRTALRAIERAVTVVAQFAKNNRGEFVDFLDNTTVTMKTILSKRRDLEEILEVFPLALTNLQRTREGNRIRFRTDADNFMGGAMGRLLTLLCAPTSPLPLSADMCEAIVGD